MTFRKYLNHLGFNLEKRRIKNRQKITTKNDLINHVKNEAGLYWIETNMPIEDIKSAIKICTGKTKLTRKTKPCGIGLTKPNNNLLVIYSGTQENLQKRLLEHLFNEGSEEIGKLSLKIDCVQFSSYDWYVSCVYIKDYPSRYAFESWWRLNIGWPPFCIR